MRLSGAGKCWSLIDILRKRDSRRSSLRSVFEALHSTGNYRPQRVGTALVKQIKRLLTRGEEFDRLEKFALNGLDDAMKRKSNLRNKFEDTQASQSEPRSQRKPLRRTFLKDL